MAKTLSFNGKKGNNMMEQVSNINRDGNNKKSKLLVDLKY